jgi:hypothetical protein
MLLFARLLNKEEKHGKNPKPYLELHLEEAFKSPLTLGSLYKIDISLKGPSQTKTKPKDYMYSLEVLHKDILTMLLV